jgi:hypothetical protein
MTWKGCEEVIIALFKVLYWYLPGGTEENHKKHIRIVVSRPRFEPGTSLIQNKSANHLAVLLTSI